MNDYVQQSLMIIIMETGDTNSSLVVIIQTGRGKIKEVLPELLI